MNRTRALHRAAVGGSLVAFGAAAVTALVLPEPRWATALLAFGLAGMVLAGQLRLRILVAGQRRQLSAASASASGFGSALESVRASVESSHADVTRRLDDAAARMDELEVRGRDARTAAIDAEHAALATTSALRHFESTLDDTAADLTGGLARLRTLVEQVPATAAELADLHRRLVGGADLPLPAPGSGSLSGAALVWVVRRLLSAERSLNVLELASGGSTTWVALALRSNSHGGHVHSLDHSPVRAAASRDALEEQGLGELATVADAPLERVGLDGRDYWWHSPGALPSRTPVDLLLVGPPLRGDDPSPDTYPALPLLHEHLVSGAVVVLGDAAGQEQVLQRWLAEFPALTRLADAGDAALLRWRGPE
ncbi:class I SAM-dependent methyltransferase [Tessaracoccus sp. OS52]|uniref:class I SAM-dependent methyltransferase n=1 Tax=Tessaracoccus sp. OS52 TaxID=2886691 RepID=UPI001D123DBB|nr:class I SAM-dependent methyltransferase [Tessaracoccus sp. OS52]